MHKIIIQSVFLSSAINIVLLLNFKKIRSLVPPPEIDKEKLVGFAQYFGHPLYFDTIFFFILILVPVLTLIFLYRINKRK